MNVNKSISPVDRINFDTQRMSVEAKVYRKIDSSNKSQEISPDTQRHKFRREDLDRAIKDANNMVLGLNRRFKYDVHEGTGRFMVKLIDDETDEVLKEIPPEKILDLVASIWDMVGILVDERG